MKKIISACAAALLGVLTAWAGVAPDWKAVTQPDTIIGYYTVKDSQSMTAVEADGSLLAAFAEDGTCRGVAAIGQGPKGKLFQIAVGIASSNEKNISFRVWDAATGETSDVIEKIDSVAGIEKVGGIAAPETLTYASSVPETTMFAVTFDLGEQGTRTGGGDLTQRVESGKPATAPEFDVAKGWKFTGWDASFASVTAEMTVRALYEADGPARAKPDWKAETQPDTIIGYYAVVDAKTQAKLEADGSLLAAFAEDGACRGVATVSQGPKGKLFQITIGIASSNDKNISFKVWDAASGVTYDVNEKIASVAGVETVGTIVAPETLTFGGQGTPVPSDTLAGNWTTDVTTAVEQATKDGKLIVVLMASYGTCTYSQAFQPVIESDAFKSWAAENGVYLITADATRLPQGAENATDASNYFWRLYWSVSHDESVVYYPTLAIARPSDPEQAVGCDLARNDGSSTVGGVLYDGTAASLIKGLSVYLDGAPAPKTYTVTFDLGGHGTRTGGGALTQTVEKGAAAVAPTFDVADGWKFTGWDKAFANVTADLKVTAHYERDEQTPEPRDPGDGVAFEDDQVSVEKGEAFVLTVNGGSADTSVNVKLGVAYVTAKASDLDLKNAIVEGAQYGIKFPLDLSWSKGDTKPKKITIPTKAGKATDAPKYLTWTLSDARGLDLVEPAFCIGMIEAGDDYAGENVCVLPSAESGEGGKVSGGGNAKPDGKGSYKPVTLKATPNKGYWFAGWYDANGDFASGDLSFKVTPDGEDPLVTYCARFVKADTAFCGTYSGIACIDLKGMTLVKGADTSANVSGDYPFTVTLSTAGKVSGSVTVGGKKVSFKGDACTVLDGVSAVFPVVLDENVWFGKPNRERLLITVHANGIAWCEAESLEGAYVPVGDFGFGVRKVIGKDAASLAKIAKFVGTYSVWIPDGEGGLTFYSLIVDAKGKAKATGRMRDGSVLSYSGSVSECGSFVGAVGGDDLFCLDFALTSKSLGTGSCGITLELFKKSSDDELNVLGVGARVTKYTRDEVSSVNSGGGLLLEYEPGCWASDADAFAVETEDDLITLPIVRKNGIVSGLGKPQTKGYTVKFDNKTGILEIKKGKEYVIYGLMTSDGLVAMRINADGSYADVVGYYQENPTPTVDKNDFTARITGVAVVSDHENYDAAKLTFVDPATPVTVPYGSSAIFRVAYDFPTGYGAMVWVRDSWPEAESEKSMYFGSNPSSYYYGNGVAYGFLTLSEKNGQACRLREAVVRTKSSPALTGKDGAAEWIISRTAVDITFEGPAEETDPGNPEPENDATDIKAFVTGVAVVADHTNYDPAKLTFVDQSTPVTVPYGSSAIFRVAYDFPTGYEGGVWVRDSTLSDGSVHNAYFGSDGSLYYTGSGVQYRFLTLEQNNGKACRLLEAEVRTASKPASNRPSVSTDRVVSCAAVDITFEGPSEEPAGDAAGDVAEHYYGYVDDFSSETGNPWWGLTRGTLTIDVLTNGTIKAVVTTGYGVKYYYADGFSDVTEWGRSASLMSMCGETLEFTIRDDLSWDETQVEGWLQDPDFGSNVKLQVIAQRDAFVGGPCGYAYENLNYFEEVVGTWNLIVTPRNDYEVPDAEGKRYPYSHDIWPAGNDAVPTMRLVVNANGTVDVSGAFAGEEISGTWPVMVWWCDEKSDCFNAICHQKLSDGKEAYICIDLRSSRESGEVMVFGYGWVRTF